MIVHALTYQQPDSDVEATIPLDRGFNALHCADTHVSRSLSRLLHHILAAGGTHGAASSLLVSGDLPGAGMLSALLATEVTPPTGDAPEIVVDGEEVNALGADLLLLTFEDLFDMGDNLARIAQQMAAIVGAGNAHHDPTAAVMRLDAFAENTGRGDDADAPLTQARIGLATLKAEYAAVKKALEQAAANATALHQCREQVMQCRLRRDAIEQRLSASVLRHAARYQEQLKRLALEIKEAGARPCIDSEQAAVIQRGETLAETARLQLERTRKDLQHIIAELDALQAAPELGAAHGNQERIERLQREIQAGHGRITELDARLDEVYNQIIALDAHIAEAQEHLTTLPDFSRIAPNPTDWLTQLASSFKTALVMRDNEEETRDVMRAELADLRVANAGDAAIFDNNANLAEELLTHQNNKKQWETRGTQITKQIRHDRSLRDELQDRMPGLFLLSLGCVLFLSLLLGAYLGLQKTPLLYPGGLFLMSALFFLAQLLTTRRQVAQLTRGITVGQAELDAIHNAENDDVSQIDRLMARAGCATVWELEARYDRYRELRGKLDALEARFEQQEQHLRESEERIPKLFERVRCTLEQVDEPPKNEDDVDGAVGRAIAKYQVYRETKRRLADLRNQHQGLLSRKRFLEKELVIARKGLPEAERQLREIMRDQGFAAEAEYRDVHNALTAYYRFLDMNEQAAGRRVALLRERQLLEARLPEEEALFEQHHHALGALLAHAEFTTPEQAREAAANTVMLRDLELQQRDVGQQCDSLLQGRAIEAWRKLAGNMAVGEDELDQERYGEELEAAEGQLDEAVQKYQALRQERRQLLAAHRPIFEIKEDVKAQETHIKALRRDISAAARAITLIEESLRAWRRQYGEAVAERASEILATLGVNALAHLELDPDVAPALEVVAADEQAPPPATLYLALRLAAAELLTDAAAPLPLIVDATLQGATLPVPPEKLLDALNECAQRRQVLLVFESEEIAAAVAARQIPALAF